jgi:hypothetical protein
MATRTLAEKIEALPPEKKAEVEDFVEFLAGRKERTPKTPSDDLLLRIDDLRERLRREHGLFSDSTAIVRELRENGS